MKLSILICVLVLGLMLGYGWRMRYEVSQPVIVKYESIAIDLTNLGYLGQTSYTETAKRSHK